MPLATVAIADHTGDTTITIDRKTKGSVGIAKAAFLNAKGKGYAAYAVINGERTQVQSWDDVKGNKNVEQVVLLPQLVGG